MSKARGSLLLSLLGALIVLPGCGPSLPDLTRQLAEGDLEPSQVLRVEGYEAELVLCEQPRLAAAWDDATPDQRRELLELAVELVSRSYEPTDSPAIAAETEPANGDAGPADEHAGMDHGDHGAASRAPESAEPPNDPDALADVWRTGLAGRAFEDCAGIEARRSSHH